MSLNEKMSTLGRPLGMPIRDYFQLSELRQNLPCVRHSFVGCTMELMERKQWAIAYKYQFITLCFWLPSNITICLVFAALSSPQWGTITWNCEANKHFAPLRCFSCGSLSQQEGMRPRWRVRQELSLVIDKLGRTTFTGLPLLALPFLTKFLENEKESYWFHFISQIINTSFKQKEMGP